MNPGLVVKLRPSGPWRIGPDSGARNRVDFIFHSDSLYSAVTAAMARLGSLEEWLGATARGAAPAVCFSSLFPFLDDIGFVVPPRTIWPPTSPALLAARVRWKSARFVPLGIVQAILSGQRLDESHWTVDAASECLLPAGRTGPFRTGVRWSAAVDRLSGATERHSTSCIEFRPGAGLWAVVSFLDDAAHARWRDPVKAAFRVLADSGFGGERSRGWGHAEPPDFIDGALPDMILPAIAPKQKEPERPPEPEPVVEAPAEVQSEPAPAPESAAVEEASTPEPEVAEAAPEQAASPEPAISSEPAASEEPAAVPLVEESVDAEASVSAPSEVMPLTAEPAPPAPEPEPEPEPAPPESDPPVRETAAVLPESEPAPSTPPPQGIQPHWLLSLFIPASSDAVDWHRGNYSVTVRGGRIESPVKSGELKKQIQMVTEGSVLYAPARPCGCATDVAPDGFAHPVYRAGFALSIPLPEVS